MKYQQKCQFLLGKVLRENSEQTEQEVTKSENVSIPLR